MANFTFAEAERILRAVESQTEGNLPRFVNRMLEHIRQKDDAFHMVTKGVTDDDFEDILEFYSWFYRWFVAE